MLRHPNSTFTISKDFSKFNPLLNTKAAEKVSICKTLCGEIASWPMERHTELSFTQEDKCEVS
jgi:hypothetical protein